VLGTTPTKATLQKYQMKLVWNGAGLVMPNLHHPQPMKKQLPKLPQR